MNTYNLKPLLLLLFSFPFLTVFGSEKPQVKKSNIAFEKALELYRELNYSNSYEKVQKALKLNSSNIQALLLLSDLCKELNMPEKRIETLESVIKIEGYKKPLAYKYVAIEHFGLGNYQLSKAYFDKYLDTGAKTDFEEVKLWVKKCDFCISQIMNPKNVSIEQMPNTINTPKHEYWPSVSVDDSTIYFTRLIDDNAKGAYERIFYSSNINGEWSFAKELLIGGEGLENEGAMCFSANGKLLFFTACERADGYGSCDIYYSHKVDGLWLKPRNAGSVINTSGWEAQPSVTPDGKELYFSSNRYGGFGKKDIWKSIIAYDKDGELIFMTPVNLGSSINTSDDDFSPFIHSDKSTLYFASKGKITFGGTDIFYSSLENNEWKPSENMGYPINSRFDDDGLVVSPTAKLALLSSNRNGALAQSKDLFRLTIPEEFAPRPMGYLKGFVYDIKNKEKLDAVIEFTDLTTGDVQQIASLSDTGYNLLLRDNSVYALNISRSDYLFYSYNIDFNEGEKFEKSTIFDIYLTPVNDGDRLVLNNVFFDFDKADLLPSSEVELLKIIDFMKVNPKLKVEVSGHTDNVGSEEYNQKLSEQRAKAIFDFLIKEINADRLSYKGFGSKIPIDTNETEIGRSKNRRSELKIVSSR